MRQYLSRDLFCRLETTENAWLEQLVKIYLKVNTTNDAKT